MKRIASAVLGLILLVVPLMLLGVGSPDAFSPTPGRTVMDGGILGELEGYLNENLPMRAPLNELNLAIRAIGGQREYNQILVAGDGLFVDLDPPVEYRVRENTDAILEFADRVGVPTYCIIIPTASAIRQESLPQFTRDQMINQKQIIEDVYAQMVGRVTVADVYTALFNNRDQYLYYRTEDNLTALGGYHLFSVLAPRLLEGTARPNLDDYSADYDIEYVKTDFYGGLYAKSPFKGVRADSLAVYRYKGKAEGSARRPLEYLVTKRQDGSYKTYHTLYPTHMLDLGHPMDVYLGGLTAVTKVQTTSSLGNNLLVLGDKTALSYLPFLVNHYDSVTLVDLFQLNAEGYETLDLRDYEQVLFAYGIESYISYNTPSWALRLLESLEEEE